MRKKKINWDAFITACLTKPKGAKGKAQIKRDRKQSMEKARKGF